jgi:hypothetical protein
MASIHELRARVCPSPDNPGKRLSPNQPNPNAIFGWQVVRRLQTKPPDILTIGPGDVTRNRILAAVSGEEVFPQTGPESYPRQFDIDYKRIKDERERRARAARTTKNQQRR